MIHMKRSNNDVIISKKTFKIRIAKDGTFKIFANRHSEGGIFIYILSKSSANAKLDPCMIQVYRLNDRN